MANDDGNQQVERVYLMACCMPGCGAELRCPDGTEPWGQEGWFNGIAATAFKAEHAALHGHERIVTAQVRYIEKE